ncbi:MAG TPA: hypothetical protein VG755_03950 [Nannocystaceae bacterium]|nr:hypothetical protein [Nannocystaceae bacterium]
MTILVATSAATACGKTSGDGRSGGSETSASPATTSSGDETSSASTTTGEGSTSGSSSSSSDTSTTAFADLPPYPTACDDPPALVDVTVAATPDGPLMVDEAWVWYDFCGAGPFVVLVQRPTVDGGVGNQVEIELQGGGPPPWLGTYPAQVRWEREASGAMELLEPFTNPHEPGWPHPDVHLHAQIEIHSGGYDLSVEVDLIDCGLADCSCPCE